MGCTCGKEGIEFNGRKYNVRSRIGEGGFSFVDLVEDCRTHKLYALKRIITHCQEDEKNAIEEVEYHLKFQHPNILKCIDWTVIPCEAGKSQKDTGEVLLLLPYHKQGTLLETLLQRAAKRDYFSEEHVLSLFLKICEGVKVMHKSKPKGLVHRDLKPANILIADDGSPVIMDLGSSGPALQEIRTTAEAHALQDLAAEKCSIPYRAPELFHVESHSTVDERTDIWSLGCLLYAMCFFKSPFEAAYERGDSIALAVVSGNVQISEDSPYSQGTHDLILSMLAVNAMERPFIDVVIQRVEIVLRDLKSQV